jgi:NADH-dependent peroxiredoxin subunit F
MAVPTVFLNGEPFGQGRMTLEQIVAKLDTGAAERAAERSPRRTLRRARRRRRPRRRRGRDLRRPQGHPHRRRRRALRRPGARHDGHRELHLGAHTEGPKLAAALEQHVRSTTSTS